MRTSLGLVLLLIVAQAFTADVALAQDAAPPRIQLTAYKIKPARGKAAGVVEGWVRHRLGGLPGALVDACYRPALARKPKLSGRLVVRLTITRGLAITKVKADPDRFKLPSLRACVVAAVRAHPAPTPAPPDPDPIAPPQLDDRPPPPVTSLPLNVTLTLQLTAPPPPPPEPKPEPVPAPKPRACGPSPEGCKRTGCPSGLVCDTRSGCVPSSCGCDKDTGAWICTSDCGGGRCMPVRPAPPPPPPPSE